MQINVTKITIVRLSHGCDRLYLETDLPASTYPFQGNADLKLECARGDGEDYCLKNFAGVPFEVVRA